jgi:hypothetical protein
MYLVRACTWQYDVSDMYLVLTCTWQYDVLEKAKVHDMTVSVQRIFLNCRKIIYYSVIVRSMSSSSNRDSQCFI